MGPHNSSNSQGNAKMIIHKWRQKSDPEYTRTYFLGKTRTKPHEVYQPRSLGVAQALFTTLAGPMTGTFKSTFSLRLLSSSSIIPASYIDQSLRVPESCQCLQLQDLPKIGRMER